MPTLEELSRLMDAARDLKSSDCPDVFLITQAAWDKLKAQPEIDIVRDSPDRLCGIPFEVYQTERELMMRAIELHGSGKRLGVICD